MRLAFGMMEEMGVAMASTRFLKLAIAVFALVGTSGVAQSVQSPDSLPVMTDHASDSYAIYSVLLSSQQLRNGQTIAIAGTTLSGDEIKSDPDQGIEPPPNNANAFYEAVRDFQAHREQRVRLQRQLKLDQGYRLLTEDELDRFSKNPNSVDGLHPDAKITRFSEGYFNPAQTAALVYIDHMCSSPCGEGQWIFLEKRNGEWVRGSSSIGDRTATYAIYSLLMPGVPFQDMSLSQAPHFAIAAQTVNIDDISPPIPPDGQLQAPPSNEQGFNEAVQDFYTRRYERAQIAHQLQLDRPYTLLDTSDVAELRTTLAGVDPGSELKDKWAGYPGITYFSEVYFDSAHTAALVYMNNFCSSLCANGQWIYLEKKGDNWVRRSGLNI
jgi:hypothetical protein